MDQIPFKFEEGERVRLRDGVDPGFYHGLGVVGNEGVVKARRREAYGYPQLFVEWDSEHWAYNQAPDGWTWQDHFEAVERTDMMPREDDRALFAEFLAWREQQGRPHEDDRAQRYAAVLSEAADALGESEAFLILVASHMDHPDYPAEGVMTVSIHRDARTERAEMACNLRAAELAGLLYAEAVLSSPREKRVDAG